jgi:hypothetical protein
MPGKRIDLTKRTFGSLRVQEFAELRSGAAYWRCKCTCGQDKCLGTLDVKATRLLRGLTEHCGALGYRRNSALHKASRAKVGVRTRKKIAKMGGEAFAAKNRAKEPK